MAKTIEVDESVFLSQTQLAKTVQSILAKPGARKKFLEAYKEAEPAAVIPELDAAKPITDAVESVRKEFQDWRKEQEEKQAKRDEEDRISKLRSGVEAGFTKLREQGVTDEGIDGVKKLMEEKGLIDPEIAWAYFERIHPQPAPAAPVNFSSAAMFNPGDTGNETMKALIASRGEDVNAVNKLVNEALSEVRLANGRGR